MAKVVICPSCQSKGSIPDESKAARIRCPKCGEMFDVKGASGGASSGTMKKPGSSAAPRKACRTQTGALTTTWRAFEPLPTLSEHWHAAVGPGGSACPGCRGGPGSRVSGKSPMLFVVGRRGQRRGSVARRASRRSC